MTTTTVTLQEAVEDAAAHLYVWALKDIPQDLRDALEAARELLYRTGHGEGEPWLPVGAGVHLGTAYIGTVGEDEALDFTALGDPVNTAARLAGVAAAGEILVSSAAAEAAGVEIAGLERRSLELRGRSEALEAVVLSVAAQGAHMAPR